MAGHGRILLAGKVRVGDERVIEGDVLRELLVWRLRPGEAVTVTDEGGGLFRARVVELKEGSATLKVFEAMGSSAGPVPEITLLQALPEKERMELVIQKTTELGVDVIVPFKSARSISLAEKDSKQKKSHRWAEVALKASKQSRRDTIPEVLSFTTFKGALDHAKEEGGLKVILWERGGLKDLRGALYEARVRAPKEMVKRVTILSGPEGGFEDSEVEEAERAGFTPISLGTRVLRAETAAIVAVALVRYELG